MLTSRIKRERRGIVVSNITVIEWVPLEEVQREVAELKAFRKSEKKRLRQKMRKILKREKLFRFGIGI